MLEARDVTFGYSGRPLLRGLSLSCAPGERVALVAPSGTGKTTLCRLLAGYETPDAGAVLLDGKPLPTQGVCPVQLIGQNPGAVLDERRRLGDSLAEASSALRPWRTMKNFTDTSSARPLDEAVRLLEAVGIRPTWLYRFPHELSGGELQRFCIARALLARPRYLIADEITTMLDAVSTAQLWHVIDQYLTATSAGLIFVTHEPALATRLSTRAIAL